MTHPSPQPTWGASHAVAITPTDGATIAETRGLHVGVSGNVAVRMVSGASVTFVGVQGVLPVQVDQVSSTGTTATNIVALY